MSPTPGIQCYQVDYLFTPIGKYKSIKTIVCFCIFFRFFFFFKLKWQPPYAYSPLLLPFSFSSFLSPPTLFPTCPPLKSLLYLSGSLPASVLLPTPSLIPASAALVQSSYWGRGHRDALKHCPWPLGDQVLVGRSECEYTGRTVCLVPDHCNKVNIAVEQVR